jgi:hypothetical protein
VAPLDSLDVATPERPRRSIGKYEGEWGRWQLLNELAGAGEITIESAVPGIIGDKRRNASTLVVWHRAR